MSDADQWDTVGMFLATHARHHFEDRRPEEVAARIAAEYGVLVDLEIVARRCRSYIVCTDNLCLPSNN